MLSGTCPRVVVDSNSVANYFLAEQLIKDLGDIRRGISQKILEKVRINSVLVVTLLHCHTVTLAIVLVLRCQYC